MCICFAITVSKPPSRSFFQSLAFVVTGLAVTTTNYPACPTPILRTDPILKYRGVQFYSCATLARLLQLKSYSSVVSGIFAGVFRAHGSLSFIYWPSRRRRSYLFFASSAGTCLLNILLHPANSQTAALHAQLAAWRSVTISSIV